MFISCFKARAVIPYLTRIRLRSTSSMLVDEQMVPENSVQQIELLTTTDDDYGGVHVEIKNSMDSNVFGDLLRASILQWRQKVLTCTQFVFPLKWIHLYGLINIYCSPFVEVTNCIYPKPKNSTLS